MINSWRQIEQGVERWTWTVPKMRTVTALIPSNHCHRIGFSKTDTDLACNGYSPGRRSVTRFWDPILRARKQVNLRTGSWCFRSR